MHLLKAVRIINYKQLLTIIISKNKTKNKTKQKNNENSKETQ